MATSHHEAGRVPAGIGHPLVRRYLAARRGPGESVALEGLWALRAAVDAGAPLDAVYICPSLARGAEGLALVADLERRGVPVVAVSERVLRRMVARDGPDGLAGLGRLRRRSLPDVRRWRRVVVIDGCDLPGNLGTIVRCADGAGADAVLVTAGRVRLTHPLVLKASMGTVLSMPVIRCAPEAARAWLRRRGVRLVVADPDGPVSYRAADLRGPVAVVVGSERDGVSPFWRAAADQRVAIPMLGRADSLNVGHAAALVLYEVLDQQSR